MLKTIAIFIATWLLSLAIAIQPLAKEPLPNQEIRDLEWGDLNFFHGWHGGHLQEPQYSADLGDYKSFISRMRQRANEHGVDLLVVDTGDRAEGNGLWDGSNPKGLYTRKLLQQLDLDLLTTGNHELYDGPTAENEFLEIVPHFNGRYLSSNIDINMTGLWEPFANRTLKFTTPNLGLNITAFGFLFNFTHNYHNTRVTPVNKALEQPWFTDAVNDTNVDLFLILAHIDTDFPELQQIHDAIRAVHPETPIQIFAGHAHQRKFKVFDAKSTALESGRYCETAGWLSLDGLVSKKTSPAPLPKDGGSLKVSRRYIDFNRASFQHHSNTTSDDFDTTAGLQMTADITSYQHTLGLSRLIGCAPHDFSPNNDPYPSPNNWYSFLTTTILPEMVYNPHRAEIPHLIFINSGSQRFDVFKGRFTHDTKFIVSPFISRFQYAMEVPWAVASRLHAYFLADPSPFFVNGDLPPSSTDYALNSKLDSSPWPKPGSRTDQQTFVAEAFTTIPGYTTKDDFGQTGDDTVHSIIKQYYVPKVLVANSSFPHSWETNPPHVVDVVFLDFFKDNVAAGLNLLSDGDAGREKNEKYDAGRFKQYMEDSNATLTALIVDYVTKHWKGQC